MAETRDHLKGLTIAPLPRPRTSADLVADTLREAIARGELKGGTPLRQEELAARFGLSRMPVRDALRILEGEGVLTLHPTRGAVVAEADPDDITEIFEIRILLECEALRLAVPQMDEAALEEAEEALERLDNDAKVGAWGRLNREFHLALYRPCGRPRLLALIDAQHNAADRYVRLILAHFGYAKASQKEHRRMLRHCRAGDAKGAVAELREHLAGAARRMRGFLREPG